VTQCGLSRRPTGHVPVAQAHMSISPTKCFSPHKRDSDVSNVHYNANSRRHYDLGCDGMRFARQYQGIGRTYCLHLQGRKVLLYMFRSVYSVSLCCSVYCLCVIVFWTAATGILGHFSTTLNEAFPSFFLSWKANARV
jgi:hypothetical protein